MRATHEFIHSDSQITARSNASDRRNFRKGINQIWQQLITFMAGNSDPKIQHVREDDWRVFDPQTNRSFHFASEQEVRVWLDQRYNF